MNAIADSRYPIDGADSVDINDAGAVAAWVASRLDAGASAVVVCGDDATIAAVATTHLERLTHRVEPLSILPLAAGELTTVADLVGAQRASKRSLRKALSKAEQPGRPMRVPTLRLVDGGQSGASLAFNFGMGAIADLVKGAGRLRRRDAARQVGSEALDIDIVVDWKKHTGAVGYVLASSLQTTWGGIAMGEGLTLRVGQSPAALLGGASRVGRLMERGLGVSAARTERIHIDGNSDYVIDGCLRHSSKPRTLALTLGPQVRVIAS